MTEQNETPVAEAIVEATQPPPEPPPRTPKDAVRDECAKAAFFIQAHKLHGVPTRRKHRALLNAAVLLKAIGSLLEAYDDENVITHTTTMLGFVEQEFQSVPRLSVAWENFYENV